MSEWIRVEVRERDEEPDWSLVPAERVGLVRERWLSRSLGKPKVWLMWRDQVGRLYRSDGSMDVRILDGHGQTGVSES